MVQSLTSKTANALWWSFCERIGQQGVQLVVWIILARLLLPEEFGLVAILAIFIAIAQAFLDSGFGQALIQKKEALHIDSCSIFYFNIVIGLVATGLFWLVAPWIATYYSQPILKPLARVMSLCVLINSFGLIQTALLTRSIDFKTQMKVSLIAAILSGIIAVTLACKGFGVWSLAIYQVSSHLFRTILLWLFNTWRPSLVFSWMALRSMFAFGSRLLASGLVSSIFDNIYLAIIGKLFSPIQLGFYSQGERFVLFPMGNLSNIAGRVTFPVFASVQNDQGRLKSGMKRAVRSLVLLNFPIMIGLMVTTKPLVNALLTPKWEPCVPLIRLFCMAGMAYPVSVLNQNLLKAKGRSDLYLRLGIVTKVLVVISMAVTYRWGIAAMICGQVVVAFLSFYLNSLYAGKLISYSPREQILDMLPYFGMAGIMGAGLYVIQWVSFFSGWGLLLCQILAGVLGYIVLNWTFGTSAFVELIGLLRNRLKLSEVPFCSIYQ